MVLFTPCRLVFFFSSRRRHTRWPRDWSSDVCSSDLMLAALHVLAALAETDGTASELLAGHDPYPSSGEITSEVPDPAAALERVREHTEKLPDAVADEDRKSVV